MFPGSGKTREFLARQVWLAIFVTGLTLILGIVLSEMQQKMGWQIVLLALGAVLLVLAVLSWLVIRYVYDPLDAMMEEIRGVVAAYAHFAESDWLITTAELARVERQSKPLEIWLVTADLLEDSMGGRFQDVVAKNLARGIRYEYFVPRRADVESRVEQMVRFHNYHPGLRVCYLHDEAFLLIPKWDFLVYNPRGGQKGERRVGYMEIPADTGEVRYMARLRDDFTDFLVGKLLSFCEPSRR